MEKEIAIIFHEKLHIFRRKMFLLIIKKKKLPIFNFISKKRQTLNFKKFGEKFLLNDKLIYCPKIKCVVGSTVDKSLVDEDIQFCKEFNIDFW